MKKFMKSLKKFYGEHRVFTILMAIVIICIIVMGILLLRYFYFGTGEAERRKVCPKISEGTIGDYIASIKTDEKTKDVKVRIGEKSDIVYITLEFANGITLVEAQSKVVASLDGFNEEERSCYDFQIYMEQEKTEGAEGFNIMGAANASGTNVVWNNNTPITPSEQ